MIVVLLLLLPVLLFVSGVCSAAETAFFSLTHRDRMELQRAHPAVDLRVATVISNHRALLLTILSANTVVNVCIFVLGTMLGWQVHDKAAATAVGIATVLAVILFGEVLAKVLATKFRVQYCLLFSRLWLVIHTAFQPIRIVLNAVLEPLVRICMPRSQKRAKLAPKDVGTLLSTGADEGVIASHEHSLLERVVAIGNVQTTHVMIPRSVVRWCDVNAKPHDVKDIVRGTHIALLPVGEGGIDAGVVGLLDVNTYLYEVELHSVADIRSHLVDARYVPETTRLDALLTMLHEWNLDLAMVVDEHGVVVGLVRTSDIVRVLVPSANTDQIDEMRRVITHEDGSFSVPGNLTAQSWKKVLAIESSDDPFPGDVSTVAGLVMHELGRVPDVGDEIVYGDIRVTVEQMFKNTLERVRLRKEYPQTQEVADAF
ncbi:MAG: DUF21 domain-containing protein [Phycisphaeraceae bacterium]|nr:DUF21 domain-containing protein [Phycisphaerales bacterium]MCB9861639.1 DUF21 domain-containing protein [Phycisphaeraceae bacterium]